MRKSWRLPSEERRPGRQVGPFYFLAAHKPALHDHQRRLMLFGEG